MKGRSSVVRWLPRGVRSLLLLSSLAACSAAPPIDPGGPLPTAQPTAAPTPTGSATPTPTTTGSAVAPQPVAGDAVERSNQFAARLMAEVAKGKNGNTTLSPTSVRMAMALVAQGAKGATRTEIDAALSLDAKASAAEAGRELEDWRQRGNEGPTVRIANRLFAEKTTPAEPAFVDVATKQFGSGVETLDFIGGAEASRKSMNGWVAKETNDKIPELFPAGAISRDTRFVVANAVYFLGDWTTAFDVKATAPMPFFVAGGSSAKQAPTMHRTATFGFAEDTDVRLAVLPYKGDGMSMVVVLPKKRDGLAAVLSKLDAATFTRWKESFSQRELELALPKFELSAGGSIKSVLIALGVRNAFGSGADFSGLGKQLAISDVIQKTYVRVDEKGTEAAAATGVIVNTTSIRPPPTPFLVDHPFAYYLLDQKTGRILFIGAINDPTAKE